MKENNKIQWREIGLQAVREAGDILREHFRKELRVRTKEDRSLVTEVDVLAEEKIIKIIKASFPSHSILAEESGGEVGEDYTWLIDALDGTTNYTIDVPLFSVVLTLLEKEDPVLAFVYNPVLEEMYMAERGKGSFLNGKDIRVSEREDLKDSLLTFGRGRDLESRAQWAKIINTLERRIRTIRVFGSSAWDLCQVARGKTEGCISIGCSPWDTLGPALIIKEAAGRVTNLEGDDFGIRDKRLVATNGRIYEEIFKIIKT